MPVHIAITRRVLPGREAEFHEALRRFLGESFLHGGVHGASMITALPGGDQREIGILRSFRDEAERGAFYKSEQFLKWEEYASTLTEDPVYRDLTGLEAWFRGPVTPPRWKMAVATFLGVFPTSLAITFLLGSWGASLPLLVRSAVIAALMVVMLTWVVMPFVTKLLRKWLHS